MLREYFIILSTAIIFMSLVILYGLVAYFRIKKMTKSKQLLYLSLSSLGNLLQLIFFISTLAISIFASSLSSKQIGTIISSVNILMYIGLYMNSLYLLQCINASLYLCTNSVHFVVPFSRCMSPNKTVNYWTKLHLIVFIPFITLFVVQTCVKLLTNQVLVASVFGWITNFIVFYINILEIIAAYKFNKHVNDTVYKTISALEITLTVISASSLFVSNFWFATMDVLSYFIKIDFDAWLMYKNIVFAAGSFISGFLIIQLILKIQISISKSSQMLVAGDYT
ncbi:Hypothetical_protein [Hexamita inflata]|uniref:Hypothetical_protein n=1 Tax=Hexamita inflata TaxID=28002 RepID=A0AA86QBI5_9EUKA|nr:Hypothetical protein HINF_LOCUS42853 [Hexamita inflata]CAI9956144.1 Hypothetical protein HINF_LOCUS43789 [Hexamita inflata]